MRFYLKDLEQRASDREWYRQKCLYLQDKIKDLQDKIQELEMNLAVEIGSDQCINYEAVAKVCHQANKAYCESIGDISQVDWDQAMDWQKQSAINGVKYHVENKNSKPCDSHVNWMKEKLDTGWKYGPAKDPEKKEHPCIVPYEELSKEQQTKDHLFLAVVRAMA